MKRLLALLAMGTITGTAPAMAQERAADPLGGLAHCFDDGEFRVASSARLPANKQFREVQTRNGAAKVSTVDGYRLMKPAT